MDGHGHRTDVKQRGQDATLQGITQQQAAREKYPRTPPAFTAVSEQTKAMVHVSD